MNMHLHDTHESGVAENGPAKTPPSAARILNTLEFGHLLPDALKAAIELELFTAIAEGSRTPAALAQRCGAAERGIRSVCDFLTVNGFLTKVSGEYGLADDTRTFLDIRSPAYIGGVADFMGSRHLVEASAQIGASIRNGGSAGGDAMREPDHELWRSFARAMLPLAALNAAGVTAKLGVAQGGPLRVLDIAASHGEYGLAIARADTQARIVAVDWPSVVAIARERAKENGVADRFETIPGSALDVDFGDPYDIVLLPNWLHGFDRATCERLLGKIHAALKPEGRLAIVEHVPNDDRISPPWPAQFSLLMLAVTTVGDSYTFAELERMLKGAGFSRNERSPLPPSPATLIVARK